MKQDNKPLISASVLGLVFEKINGYREGSFFTPSFITMYMARETLRKTVLDKFSEQYHLPCDTLAELSNAIRQQQIKPKDANAVINNLKICDPAVGSGHFLVSVLNELIAIKSELGILTDYHGQLLDRYEVTVSNDELEVTNNDHQRFQYTVSWDAQTGQRRVNKETQRLQQALFHEKQQLIENCLFGVDLNTNSVQICRLRLWIELLKNAYYRADENYQRLEILPNIDINIKEGNALVSKFAQDLSDIDKQVVKTKVKEYKVVTDQYKEVTDPERKKGLNKQIRQLKEELEQYAIPRDEDLKKYKKKERELKAQVARLGEGQKELVAQTSQEFTDLEEKVREKYQTIYKNALEWPLEFPEVVNQEGNFKGFDVVIGNPPYISAQELKKSINEHLYKYYKDNFETAKGTIDLYIYFFELSLLILKKKGNVTLITPNKYLSAPYGKGLRNYLLQKTKVYRLIDYSNVKVFKEASTYPVVTFIENYPRKHYKIEAANYDEKEAFSFREFSNDKLTLLNDQIWGFLLNEKIDITERIVEKSIPIKEIGKINATSTAKEAEEFHHLINEKGGYKLVNTGTIDKYCTLWGVKELTDKGKKFLTPYLPAANPEISKNRYSLFDSPKIIFAKIAIAPEAIYDEIGEFASMNTNCLHSFEQTINPKFVLAWVNSKLFQFLFECFFEGLKMAGGYLTYSAPTLSSMYIFPPNQTNQNQFIKVVDEIIDIKENDPSANTNQKEEEIDKMFYELYGLTEEEVEIVENNV